MRHTIYPVPQIHRPFHETAAEIERVAFWKGLGYGVTVLMMLTGMALEFTPWAC